MSNNKSQYVKGLFDNTSGALMGFLGVDGKEYLLSSVTSPETAYKDASATPGTATLHIPRGRLAIAAGQSSVVVTNNTVTASSHVIVTLDGSAADTTLTSIVRVVPAAGSFTVYGNAAATAACPIRFAVMN